MGMRKNRFGRTLTSAVILFSFFFQEGCALTQKTVKRGSPRPFSSMSKEEKEKLMLEKLYQEGNAAFKERNYDKAVDMFLKILAIRPNYRDVQKKLDAYAAIPAQKPMKEKSQVKPPPSLAQKKKSEREQKEEMMLEALYQKGNKALKDGDYDTAIDAFIQILDIRANYRDVRKKLVKAHQKKETHPALPPPVHEKKEASPFKEYTVNLGDILDISVWQWEDLKAENVYVRPDGKISFPLVGDVQAVGKTLTEIDQDVTQRLSEFIKSPEVSVAIRKFGGKKVIVLGEVSGQGVYAPTGRSTILEVVALAGGFRETAVTSNVIVIRGDAVRSEAIVCNLRQALKQGDLSENITVEANDIIFVPRRFITNVGDLAGELSGPIGTTLAGIAVLKEFNFHRARK